MNKANQLYWQAKGAREQKRNLATDFVAECIKDFEQEAEEGYFSSRLYMDNVPDNLYDVFEDLVIPLFEEEGFTVSYEDENNFGPGPSYHWRISWDLKEGEVQYE